MTDLEFSRLSENVFPYSHSKPRLTCNQRKQRLNFYQRFYFDTQGLDSTVDGNGNFVVNIAYILSDA